MATVHSLSQREELTHDIPVSAQPGMLVGEHARRDELWEQISGDRSLAQLMNVATLPGIARFAFGMPDVHEGYGFPVGGVAALRAADGVISPGGVGYDINCGVRLLASDLPATAVRLRIGDLVHELSRSVPAGAGRGSGLSLAENELESVLAAGCRYLAERGLAELDDLEATEANGCLARADPGGLIGHDGRVPS